MSRTANATRARKFNARTARFQKYLREMRADGLVVTVDRPQGMPQVERTAYMLDPAAHPEGWTPAERTEDTTFEVVLTVNGTESVFGSYGSADSAGKMARQHIHKAVRDGGTSVTYRLRVEGGQDVSGELDGRQRWLSEHAIKQERRTCANCQHTMVNSGGVWLIFDGRATQFNGVTTCPPQDEASLTMHKPEAKA